MSNSVLNYLTETDLTVLKSDLTWLGNGLWLGGMDCDLPSSTENAGT